MSMDAYAAWADIDDEARVQDFQSYVNNIADARYVIRRVLRIVDEQAKKHGLEPLQHQALLQVYGSEGDGISISRLGARLDVAAAFASRLVTRLEAAGLLRREQSREDKRSTIVLATTEGAATLVEIDRDVHHEVAYLQHQLSDRERVAALSIFSFYVGIDPASKIAGAIRDARRAQH